MKLPALLLAVLVLAPAAALAAPGQGQAKGPAEHGPGNPPGHQDSGAPPGHQESGGPPGHAGNPPAPPGHQDNPPAPPAGSGAVLSPEGLVTIGTDQNIALEAVRAGDALPLDSLLPFASRYWGGRVIDAKLLRSNRGYFYRLTMLTDDGVSRRVFLDARTGRPATAP